MGEEPESRRGVDWGAHGVEPEDRRTLAAIDPSVWVTYRLALLLAIMFLSLIAIVLGGAALVYVVKVTSDIRDTQIDGTPLGKKIAKANMDTATTLALLQDCLDPEGDCGKRSAANQQAALDQVKDYTFIVNYCIDKPGEQSVPDIQRCFDRYEKRHKKTPQP